MMEILCSETNRMDKNCRAALNPRAARTSVRGKRMAVRRRKVWWESVEVKFEPCIARASGDCGSVISFKTIFRAFNQPQKARSAAGELYARIKWQCPNVGTRRPAVAPSIIRQRSSRRAGRASTIDRSDCRSRREYLSGTRCGNL